MTQLIVALVAVVIILALIPLTKRAMTTKMRTFQATVNYKCSTATTPTVWISDK